MDERVTIHKDEVGRIEDIMPELAGGTNMKDIIDELSELLDMVDPQTNAAISTAIDVINKHRRMFANLGLWSLVNGTWTEAGWKQIATMPNAS